jgi:uncharacterized protein
MHEPLQKTTTAPAETVDGRRLKFVISDGGVDRDNDTIDAAGWDLASYRENPVMLWAHDHTALPIARAVSIGVEGSRLVAMAEFATHDFAETVYQLYRGGFLRATSVGFRPLDYVRNAERGGIDFKRQELLEFSAVPVPANARALVQAAASGINVEAVKAWARKALALPMADEPGPDADDEPALLVEDDDRWHGDAEEADEQLTFDDADLASALREVLANTVRRAAQAGVDRARGRIVDAGLDSDAQRVRRAEARCETFDIDLDQARALVRQLVRDAAQQTIARVRGRLDD